MTENVSIMRSGYSSRIFDMSKVPIPDPVVPVSQNFGETQEKESSCVKNIYMHLRNTTRASLRCSVSAHDATMIYTVFSKDLIHAGHLGENMSYLACVTSKLRRVRKASMEEAVREQVKQKFIGLGFHGRKDKNAPIMMTDSNNNTKMGVVTEKSMSLPVVSTSLTLCLMSPLMERSQHSSRLSRESGF